MDPDACLARLIEAAADNDVAEVAAAFSDYVAWRNKGGASAVVNSLETALGAALALIAINEEGAF